MTRRRRVAREAEREGQERKHRLIGDDRLDVQNSFKRRRLAEPRLCQRSVFAEKGGLYDLLANEAGTLARRCAVTKSRVIASAPQIPAVPATPFAGTLRGAHSLS